MKFYKQRVALKDENYVINRGPNEKRNY